MQRKQLMRDLKQLLNNSNFDNYNNFKSGHHIR